MMHTFVRSVEDKIKSMETEVENVGQQQLAMYAAMNKMTETMANQLAAQEQRMNAQIQGWTELYEIQKQICEAQTAQISELKDVVQQMKTSEAASIECRKSERQAERNAANNGMIGLKDLIAEAKDLVRDLHGSIKLIVDCADSTQDGLQSQD